MRLGWLALSLEKLFCRADAPKRMIIRTAEKWSECSAEHNAHGTYLWMLTDCLRPRLLLFSLRTPTRSSWRSRRPTRTLRIPMRSRWRERQTPLVCRVASSTHHCWFGRGSCFPFRFAFMLVALFSGACLDSRKRVTHTLACSFVQGCLVHTHHRKTNDWRVHKLLISLVHACLVHPPQENERLGCARSWI